MEAIPVIICVFISILAVWIAYRYLGVRSLRLLVAAASLGLFVYMTLSSHVVIVSKDGDEYKYETVRTFYDYKQFNLRLCGRYIFNTTSDKLVIYPVLYAVNGYKAPIFALALLAACAGKSENSEMASAIDA